MSRLEEPSILMNTVFPWMGAKGDMVGDCQSDSSIEAYHILEDLPQIQCNNYFYKSANLKHRLIP